MLFNSFQFVVFYLVVALVFSLLRGAYRKLFLLLASYYFYMCWSTRYIWVIWAITLIDFAAGICIEKSATALKRKTWLSLSVICNLGLLGFFKYLNFLDSSLSHLLAFFGIHATIPILNILLPVGISFHTFQALSYTIDVYREKAKAEHSLLNYALYVAFFPQMVAGPIERPNQFLPQLGNEANFKAERIRSGLATALWGFFKKMVLADSLSGVVTVVYNSPANASGKELIFATLCFAIQIYCDFSGYSDIAIGLARCIGYELRINFLQPYYSRSIGEFWRRWHISLSTWFRDYVYITLGGSRVPVSRHYINIIVTFLLSGLWHGASWSFLIWGAIHGCYLIFGDFTSGWRRAIREWIGLAKAPKLERLWQTSITFSLVTIAWIFFRASNVSTAVTILSHLSWKGGFNDRLLIAGGLPRATAPFIFALAIGAALVEWWIAHPHRAPRVWKFAPVRQLGYQACLFSIICFGVFGHTDFIYFQF